MNIDAIVGRTRIIRGIRKFFDEAGFVEVDTAVRLEAPAPECNIDCPPVSTGGFLRASPELQMKKLLAAGMERIYQIGPCFRDGERGARHNPEFTMLEWYRRGATYRDIADDMRGLLASLGVDCAPVTMSVRDAYLRFAGWDPWERPDHDRFDVDMATKIEPALKTMGGVFLTDYPPDCASLAIVRDGVAERWEFYLDGVELANCFTELCDPAEQLRRFRRERDERSRLGESDYPIDMDFIDCIGKIGSASGVALGVDRLVMSILGVRTISDARAPL